MSFCELCLAPVGHVIGCPNDNQETIDVIDVEWTDVEKDAGRELLIDYNHMKHIYTFVRSLIESYRGDHKNLLERDLRDLEVQVSIYERRE